MDRQIALKLLHAATKVPSGHNTQPWLFEIGDASITLHPDFRAELPVVDPLHRELFISLGCAAENLAIEASTLHHEAETHIEELGTIRFSIKPNPEPLPHPLQPYIATRQTNRSRYSGTIDTKTIERLLDTPLEPSTTLRFYANGSKEYHDVAALVLKGDLMQLSDPLFTQELYAWIRINRKEVQKHRNGLSYATFGAPSLPAWISRPIFRRSLTPKKQLKREKRLLSSSSHLALFTTTDNTPTGWIRLGKSLQRVLLQATGLGLAHAYLNQPNELPLLSQLMVKSLQLGDETPCILLRIGYAEKTAYAPRRPIHDVIKPTD